MGLSDEDRQAYLDQIRPEVEAAVDAVFLQQFGRTYNDAEMKGAPITHAEKNGDSSQHPAESWQQLTRDFPGLFGGDA